MSKANVATKTLPTGLTLLTLASTDKTFECHLDVTAATTATLGIGPKTGGPIIRIATAAGDVLCSIIGVDKANAGLFASIRAELGDSVALGETFEEAAEVATCRKLSGGELEVELANLDTPIVLDCFGNAYPIS